ncbi:unnamed protein product [Macrosiphum euphorbiae]|uniref:Uncharacterized protein n=1 Tax=Macrosiphum euphorbiae TaxID=13131 RepID=A0AAV0Y7X2_9HEMI|nr:unnamed protein product [Macrosiphum euphorbiae]
MYIKNSLLFCGEPPASPHGSLPAGHAPHVGNTARHLRVAPDNEVPGGRRPRVVLTPPRAIARVRFFSALGRPVEKPRQHALKHAATTTGTLMAPRGTTMVYPTAYDDTALHDFWTRPVCQSRAKNSRLSIAS